jgi:hypothetical protein
MDRANDEGGSSRSAVLRRFTAGRGRPLGGGADLARPAGDHLGARPPLPVVSGQPVPAGHHVAEHDSVFEGLAGSLPEIGGHGVGGVPGSTTLPAV